MKAMPAKPTNHTGFTIVETMIVLGIAGLILLVVFLAIPALQRSSRNNQRRQDVQAILEAVSRYELNDSGKFPDNCGDATEPACSIAVGGTTPNDYFLQFVADKLTYYNDPGGSTGGHVIAKGGHQAPQTPDTEKVYIYNYQHCAQTGGGATSQGAGYSDVVALYALESGSATPHQQCEQL